MRLFSALLPPRPAVDELGDRVDALRARPGADRLRWTERAGWHLTLAFYGEVPEHAVAELRERLAGAAARSRPLPLLLAGGGLFGHRTLWTAVESAGPGALTSLRHLAAASALAGRRTVEGAADRLHFVPHLTLARATSRRPPEMPPLLAALEDFRGSPWTADRLTLMLSDPAGGKPGAPPRYRSVDSWPLGSSPSHGDGAHDGGVREDGAREGGG